MDKQIDSRDRRNAYRAATKKSHGNRAAQRKRWRERNPLQAKIELSRWRAANPERVSAYNAAYWRSHPDARHFHGHRRRALLVGNGGEHTHQEWIGKIALLGNVCFYCGEAKPLTEDHNIPLTRGGTDDIANVLPACAACNSRKRNKTAREFLGLTA